MSSLFHAFVHSIRYKDQNPQQKNEGNVLEVKFEGPKGDIHEHILSNENWSKDCQALQFLAYCDLKPSEINGTAKTFEDENLCVPVQRTKDGFYLSSEITKKGKELLEHSNWFHS